MGSGGRRYFWLVATAIFGAGLIYVWPLLMLLFLLAGSSVLSLNAALTPNTFRDVTISVNHSGRHWSETVRVACVSITDGIALRVYLTRTEFPEFTVISLDDGRALLVPIVSACDRRERLRQGTPFLADSATAPTWIAPAAEAGFDIQTTARSVAASPESDRIVHNHVARVRDETIWGAFLDEVNGRLVKTGQRLSGGEFARIERTILGNSITDIPNGGVVGQCIAYGPPNSEAAMFRTCATSVWNRDPSAPAPTNDIENYCGRFQVIGQCTRVESSGCVGEERFYRRNREEEFSSRIGRTTWTAVDTPLGCHGVIGNGHEFSVLSLSSAGLFLLLEPSELKNNRHIQSYLRVSR